MHVLLHKQVLLREGCHGVAVGSHHSTMRYNDACWFVFVMYRTTIVRGCARQFLCVLYAYVCFAPSLSHVSGLLFARKDFRCPRNISTDKSWALCGRKLFHKRNWRLQWSYGGKRGIDCVYIPSKKSSCVFVPVIKCKKITRLLLLLSWFRLLYSLRA